MNPRQHVAAAGRRRVGDTGAPQSTSAVPLAGATLALASGRPARTPEDAIRERSSPLVRKIAKEHNVDIAQIHGTGIAGRVTKDDILGFIEKGTAGQAERDRQEAPGRPEGQARKARLRIRRARGCNRYVQARCERSRREDVGDAQDESPSTWSLSKRTSAHVHSVFEVNFGRVAKIREAKKAEFERAGAKLTYMSFIVKAAIDALRAVPVVNASVDGDNIVYHKDINLGIAVALDWGLIVPVIKQRGREEPARSQPRRGRSGEPRAHASS